MILETDFGRFEADSEAELIRLSRAAKRNAAKIEDQRGRDYKTAALHAHANGYLIYYRACNPGGGTELVAPDKPCGPKRGNDANSVKTTWCFETVDGVANIELYQDRHMIGALVDGGGFAIGYVAQDVYGPVPGKTLHGKTWVMALACCGNQTAICECPGVAPG